MPASPAIRCSPGREPRADNHKRGRSLENGIVFKERDDDLALFNEVQNRESDNFLLQSNDDFEDTFVNKLRHFSDHQLGINVAARGESSDLLNAEEEKNDYEWLLTPPDTPLFTSLDDETPQVILPQRGRPRAQPISISRSSTMEKNQRSTRGSPSPNRLSPSPRSREPTFQPRSRATSAPSSSPPPTRRPATGSKRPSSPSSKPSTPPRRASTPTSRRLSTGSVTTTSTSARGVSVNSSSPKIRAWQANIPGFSTEAPPNLRTSLADRPASYVRGSSPASRNGRHSMSPVASRSISSSHSHDRDKFSSYSKGSIASSGDDDVESLPSVIVDGSQRLNSKRVSGIRNNNNNNKAPFSPKPNRTVSSSSAPKRSFDLALRQMDHKKGPQNMFRPLLSSVPTSNLYAGKTSPAWNSSFTTSSNASSDFGTSGPHEIEENEIIDDDATSGYTKVPDCNVDDEVFMFEKTDTGNETRDILPKEERDTTISVVSDDFNGRDDFREFETLNDTLVCSRCGCEYAVISQTEDDVKLCANCQKSTSSLIISDTVTCIAESTMSDKDHELANTVKPQLTQMPLVKTESPDEHELIQVNQEVISQPILSYIDTGGEQFQHIVDFPESKVDFQESNVDFQESKVDSLEKEGISTVFKRSTTMPGPVIRTGNFSASSISYDDLSYVRESTNSMRSSIGRGSFSASSSIDFGPRFHRQSSSRKSEIENYKNDPVNVKHQRSVSSLSGASSHAFHPSSVGTSTLDSFDVPIVHVETDVADSASVVPQENPSENDTFTENVVLPESLNVEETASFQNVEDQNPKKDTGALVTCTFETIEDLGKDTSALVTCTFEEGTSVNPCGESTNVAEVQLGGILEGESDHNTCDSSSSSSASQCDVSQRLERNIEDFQDPPVSVAVDKDVAVSAINCDTSNHSSSVMEESTVLVEGKKGTKGRSLTLEEATDTILFCSSIVQNIAYEAATIAIAKETRPNSPDNNNSFPLIPAVTKGNPGRKDNQNTKTKKRSSKSQKTKRKTLENDTTKGPNNTNIDVETDLPKTRIVYSNNKENTEPLKLESKCNCIIM